MNRVLKNNRSIYVVCKRKTGIPIKEGWTAEVYTSKAEAVYMTAREDRTVVEYIPKRIIK